jgi:hypothetical protein
MQGVLTIKDVAGLLRCSRAHVLNIMLGRIQGVPPLGHITLGRRKVIRRNTFEDWLARSEAGADLETTILENRPRPETGIL